MSMLYISNALTYEINLKCDRNTINVIIDNNNLGIRCYIKYIYYLYLNFKL